MNYTWCQPIRLLQGRGTLWDTFPCSVLVHLLPYKLARVCCLHRKLAGDRERTRICSYCASALAGRL